MKDIVIAVGTAIGSSLVLARAIRNHIDCNVFVLCTDQRTSRIIGASKFVDDVYLIDLTNNDDYIKQVKKWRLTKDFQDNPILYFTYDTSCFLIDQERAWFESYFELCLPSSEIIRTFTEKGVAEIKAEKAGLFIPKTEIISSETDINKIENGFLFPVILKPRATYLKNNVHFKTKLIHDRNELREFCLSAVTVGKTFLCQEFIPGSDHNVFYYLFYRDKDGRIYENMGKKILQSPPGGGIMAKGLVEYSEELSLICQKFLNVINYNGMGGIEFKKHNGKFYFIEMNVRVEAILQIAEVSNTPLSLASYNDTSGLNETKHIEIERQRDGHVFIDFIPLIVTRLRSKEFILLLKDLGSILFDSKVKLNVFDKKDPKPFYKLFKNLIFK